MMNPETIDRYMQQLEELTMEWKRSQIPQKDRPARKPRPHNPGIWTIRAQSCFDGEEHLIHIKKQSDLHAGHPHRPHKHDFFEFNFVCKGQCHNTVDDQEFLYGPETIILMNPNAVHSCWVESTESQVVNLLVRTQAVEKVFMNLLSDGDPIFRFFLDSLYGQEEVPSCLVFHSDEKVQDIFYEMVDEFLNRGPFYQQMMMSDMFKLFVQLLRLNPSPRKLEHAPPPSPVSKVLSYIRQNYATCSLQELSEIFHYSTSYLSRIIKEETGKPFSELQTQYRLESACNFLRNSTFSAETIASIIGYCDVSYFYKVFKKTYHMNPTDYRRAEVSLPEDSLLQS